MGRSVILSMGEALAEFVQVGPMRHWIKKARIAGPLRAAHLSFSLQQLPDLAVVARFSAQLAVTPLAKRSQGS